jgi:hypothetical protein
VLWSANLFCQPTSHCKGNLYDFPVDSVSEVDADRKILMIGIRVSDNSVVSKPKLVL